MINKFIVYGIPRVGSNFFISQLNLHPNILCHYEVFHKKSIYLAFEKNLIDFSLEDRNKDPQSFVEHLWDNNHGEKTVGYNIFPNQNEQILQASAQDKTLKKIILKRKDILKNFISLKIASQTGSWSSNVISNKDKRIHFDLQEFISYVNRMNTFYVNLENNIYLNNDDCLILYYEDFIADKQKKLNEVFDFLGESEFVLPVEHKFKKQNPEKIEDLVINYFELDEFLKSGFIDFVNYK